MMIHNCHKELDIKLPKSFVEQISDFNNLYIKGQIHEIKRGVNMKKDEISREPSEKQMIIGEKWCIEHNLRINHTFSNGST